MRKNENNIIFKNLSIALCSILLASSTLNAKEDEISELDSITVTTQDNSAYITNETPNISRTNIKLEDTSKSIQSFSKEFIDEFQMDDIEQIITLSSNVISFGDNNGRNSLFAIRGFINVPTLRDGINFTSSIASPEVFNLESIEVLKGPSSFEYGQGGAGGLINLVKKKATQKETSGKITLQASSEGEYSTKFDIAGSANEDGSIRYRVVTSYTQEDEDGYNTDTQKIFFAPSLQIDLNDNNTLNLVAEYYKVEEPTDYGTPMDSDGNPIGDSDDILSHPDDDMKSTQKIVGFDLNSNMSSWDSVFRYRYIDYMMDMGDTYLPVSYVESTDTLNRWWSDMYVHNKEHNFQYTVNKDFELGESKHKISAGIDYSKLNQDADANYAFTFYSIDYSDQDFEDSIDSISDQTSTTDFLDSFDIDKTAVFLQDNINIKDKFITNLGLRSNKVKVTEEDNEKYTYTSTTPSIGFVYKPSKTTSVYANYSKSFHMQDVRYQDSDGHLVDPEEGIGYEIGIKQKLLNNNLSINASIFKIDKENVAMYDTDTLSYFASETQTSKGFEFDITGKISKDFSLMASYGYTIAKGDYYYGGTYYTDKYLVGVPKHSANLYGTYHINSNIYLGAGSEYIGKRYADYTNDTTVDSVIIYNATLGYKQNDWSTKLSIKNITDEVYYESIGSGGLGSTLRNNYLGDPRTFVASLTYEF